MNTMIFSRKYRRLMSYIRQHPIFTMFFITTIIFIVTFHKEIIYHLYIQTVDLRPYEHAITFWSTDFHIRFINYIGKFK